MAAGKKTIRTNPARRGTIRLTLVLSALVLVNCYVFLWRDHTSIPAVMKQAEGFGGAEQPSPPTPVESEAPVAAADDAPPTTLVEGKVEKGDTLGRILKSNGLDAAAADECLRALATVFDMKSLRPGQTFRIEKNPDGSVRSFELVVSKVKTVRVARDADGVLVGVADEAQTRIEVQSIAARIDHSLYASIKAAGGNTSLVAFFVDVFSYDLDFYNDTHPGDTFRVMVEAEYKDQEFLRYRRILGAEYAGKAGTFRAFFWGKRYYDDKGRSVEKSMLKTPLKFTRISSKFNRHRMHPILHRERGHFGVDYAAPLGTPVWAAASGKIISRGPAGGAGNMVVIKHDGGLVTKYMHLSKFGKQKVGDFVAAKTVIGYVGRTGLATGNHLHFSVIKDGQHVDPLKLAPTRGRGVPKAELADFKAEVAKRIADMEAIPLTTASAPDDDSDADVVQ